MPMTLNSEQFKVKGFYDNNPQIEWERVDRHPMEFALTQKAILEYGPKAPASVADIGGGPGRYAIWLARLGYAVTLLDLSEGNLRIAEEQSKEAGVAFTEIVQGTATQLDHFEDEQFEALLLLGPLYHLANKNEQIQAIQEAKRILKTGGVLFAAFLNRYGLIRYLAHAQPALIKEDAEMIESLLRSGDARSEKYPASFSNFSYWAHPDEIEPLMAECNLEKLAMLSAEGGTAYIDDKIRDLEEELWNRWVDLNYRLGKEPALYGSAIHLLYVGKK